MLNKDSFSLISPNITKPVGNVIHKNHLKMFTCNNLELKGNDLNVEGGHAVSRGDQLQ